MFDDMSFFYGKRLEEAAAVLMGIDNQTWLATASDKEVFLTSTPLRYRFKKRITDKTTLGDIHLWLLGCIQQVLTDQMEWRKKRMEEENEGIPPNNR